MTEQTLERSGSPTGFHIMMPPGWVRYLADDEGKKALIAKTSARMRELGRPDLDAQARTLVEVQWRRLRTLRISAVYLPGETTEPTPPASIAVRQHVAGPGADFHASVRSIADTAPEEIETPVGLISRWQTDSPGEGELSQIRSRQIGYAFALPGEGERRGLIFVAAIPYPADADPQMVESLTNLIDTVMETFRWR